MFCHCFSLLSYKNFSRSKPVSIHFFQKLLSNRVAGAFTYHRINTTIWTHCRISPITSYPFLNFGRIEYLKTVEAATLFIVFKHLSVMPAKIMCLNIIRFIRVYSKIQLFLFLGQMVILFFTNSNISS